MQQIQQHIKHINTLIIGQGLAGSILAWKLMQQGQTVTVLADEAAASASRVAAGILNPVTGQRLVLQKHAERIIPTALQCYQELENHFSQRFFHHKSMLRIFKHDHERLTFAQRQQDPAYTAFLGADMDNFESVRAAHGLGEQKQTGYLDTNALLDCLRDYFIAQASYIATHVEYADLKCNANTVNWRHLQADRIIFCQGFMDKDNPWFNFLPFQPAQGEILTLSSRSPLPDHIINAGKWLLPLHNGHYKTGATYSHDLTSNSTTEQAKEELMQALQQFFDMPIDIDLIDQQAGVRPNTLDKHPFIGFHPEQQRIGIFNGFGSKGSMLIPYYAQKFSQYIVMPNDGSGAMIPAEADIIRIVRAKKEKQPRVALTERVHQHLLAYMQPEHISIDATAGNGHDTLFLARQTSQQGHVFAFDIQAQAIESTRRRLNAAGFNDSAENSPITLFCSGHEHMLVQLPATILGKVNLIMFNLGYLPQSNKKVITQTTTTLQALDAALQLLAPDGRISILAYPGHSGGDQEAFAVQTWLNALPANSFTVIRHKSLHAQASSPQWMEVLPQA